MNSQQDEIQALLNLRTEAIDNPKLRSKLFESLIDPPRLERRFFVRVGAEPIGKDVGDVWLFLTLPNQRVGLAYSVEGYAVLGRKWGLIWLDQPHYGDPVSWYESLIDLIEDSGYFQE
jgi:hypothetical protein